MKDFFLTIQIPFFVPSFVIIFVSFLDQCRELKFPSSLLFEGERLIHHVLASAGVVDKDICELKCYMEHNCVSINFEVKPSASGTHTCELNNATHKEQEKDLVKAANYLYHGTHVRISCTKTDSLFVFIIIVLINIVYSNK